MILTHQQKFIVEATKQLQYLRVRQLHAMLQAHYGPKGVEIGEHRMSTMLRQLRTASNCIFPAGRSGDLRASEDLRALSGGH